ncbi:MAG: hypothetical protein U0R44_00840 [Candidatus Micrarchaeia archaeon]
MQRMLALIVLSSLLLGCVQPQEGTHYGYGEEFKLRINQTASVGDDGLSVTFGGVSEDSRCPSDVVCIWAGRVSVDLKVIKNSDGPEPGFLIPIQLTKGQGNDSASFSDSGGRTYLVKLAGVEPYPRSDEPRNASAYVATLTLSKAG